MSSGPDFGDAYTEFHAGPPRMFSAAEFAKRQMKLREWLVYNIAPQGQVWTLDGNGGDGKSTLILHLAACALTGRAWLDQSVTQGPVIYLASEDDADEIQRRLDAICTHLRVGFEDLTDLHIWPLATDDPALVVADRDDTLRPTARWAQLVSAVERIKPVALFLDSRADVFGGNEISRAQARGFIGMLRQLAVNHGVSIGLLSHPSLSGMASGSGSSGSTHWRNAVRAALYLKRPDDAHADPDQRLLEVTKSNYAAAGLSLKIRYSVGAFVLEEGGAPKGRDEAVTEVDHTFLRLLRSYAHEGRRVSHNTGANYAPAVFAKDPRAAGVRSAGFMAAMMRLFAAGKIKVEEVGPPSRRLQQLVAVDVEVAH